MKTPYFRRRKPFFSAGGRIILGAIALLILIILFIRLVFPGTFAFIFSPLWKLGDALTPMVHFPESAATMRAELAQLKEERNTLANENSALRARLRDVGAEREIPSEAGILAGVLARPPVSPYDTLVLDRGTNNGISIGAIVYAEGVPVGTVTDAAGSFSRASLYSEPGRMTEAWVGEERLPITLKGAGSGAFGAEMAREAIVNEGDIVYFPGPGAVPGGSVIRVDRHESSPKASVRVRPLVNPFTITWVRILP